MDLNKLQASLQQGGKASALPPVEQWNPPFCGDLPLFIAQDGRWFYQNSPIGRHALVKLFASVLKKEDEQYFLVTPVEKVGINVEDVPFVITEWELSAEALTLTTQTGDTFICNNTHPLELRVPPVRTQDDDTQVPYVNVRRNLWARFHQNVYYALLEQCEQRETQTHTHFEIHTQAATLCLGAIPHN